MTCRCPQHGFQLCCLVSPDLIDSERDASRLRLVFLITRSESGVRTESVITTTEEFAQRWGITQNEMDYETVFVDSEWYSQLHALCYQCYCQRWPAIIERLKNEGY